MKASLLSSLSRASRAKRSVKIKNDHGIHSVAYTGYTLIKNLKDLKQERRTCFEPLEIYLSSIFLLHITSSLRQHAASRKYFNSQHGVKTCQDGLKWVLYGADGVGMLDGAEGRAKGKENRARAAGSNGLADADEVEIK